MDNKKEYDKIFAVDHDAEADCEKMCNMSASHFLNLKGDRRRIVVNCNQQEYPPVGSIIIYNEIERAHENGRPRKPDRGIAMVKSYSTNLMLLELFSSPTYKHNTCFTLNDVRLGLVKYRYLKDYLYIANYSYADLDMDNLHEDIKRILK